MLIKSDSSLNSISVFPTFHFITLSPSGSIRFASGFKTAASISFWFRSFLDEVCGLSSLSLPKSESSAAISNSPWLIRFWRAWMIWGITTFLKASGSWSFFWISSRLKIKLNRFLTYDSVLPSIMLAISRHLFPTFSHFCRKSRSSPRLHWLLLMEGSNAVSHLSLHCLPFRCVNWNLSFWLMGIDSTNSKIVSYSFSAILDHSLAPCWTTSCFRISSSFFVHLVLLPPNFYMNSHLF